MLIVVTGAQDPQCFACGRKIKGRAYWADTRDDQQVHVGPDCAKHIEAAADAGWQPPPRKGWANGPRLFPLPAEKVPA